MKTLATLCSMKPSHHSSLFDFERLQRKQSESAPSLPPSNQTLSEEAEDSLSPQPIAATEEPEEPSSLPTSQIVQEPLLPIQTTTTVLPLPEISKVSVASTTHPAQEETAALPVQVFPISPPSDTEAQEVSTSTSVTSTPQPVQTATSLPLNSVVSSVLPVQAAPTQTPQPEVEQLKCFVLLHFFQLLVLYILITCPLWGFCFQIETSNHNFLQELNGQPIMAAPVFTKVEKCLKRMYCILSAAD